VEEEIQFSDFKRKSLALSEESRRLEDIMQA
jgi:hypothetical protein